MPGRLCRQGTPRQVYTHDLKFAPIWRAAPKVVFSRALTEPGRGARVSNCANLAEEVTALCAVGRVSLVPGAGNCRPAVRVSWDCD
ncbi:hypothetical protein ACWCQL_29170 [Streptomyces sp. NPDC002073]